MYLIPIEWLTMELNIEYAILALNLGALVWGAAKISAAVSHLDRTVTRLDKHMRHADEERANLRTRVTVLERISPSLQEVAEPEEAL